jgi:hypothetical protein
MSVRSVFGNIQPPAVDEQIVYSLDGIAKLSGLKLDGDSGAALQVVSADGDGKMRWRSVIGEQGPPGADGAPGLPGANGADGLEQNVAFFSKDLDQATAAAVAADSGNVPGVNYWELADEKLSFIRTATLPAPNDNKFNFYTFSADPASLGDMAIGRLHTISAIFDLDKPADVKPFIAIYTKPKSDGTDRASWYNSKFTILCETGVEYSLLNADPVASRISTSYTFYDEILTVSIGSDSTESTIDWTFSLESMRIFLNGRPGLRGTDGSLAVGVNDPLALRPFNYLVFNEPLPYEYELPSAITHLGRTITVYNAGPRVYVVSPVNRILDGVSGIAPDYLRIDIITKKFASVVALDIEGTARWVALAYSAGVTFNG